MGVDYIHNVSEFRSLLSSSGNKLVVVDFTATWCGPCRAIAPLFERLATTHAAVAVFVKVDVDDAADVARECSVSSMPTFHFYRSGSLVHQFSGADPGQLSAAIAQHAPSAASVSFAGSGNRLGSSTGGAPTIDWGAPNVAASLPASTGGTGSGSGAAASGSAAAPSAASDDAAAPKNDKRLPVNESFLASLLEMGFPRVRAEKALILTGNKSVDAGMEWVFAHSDDADIDEPLQVVTSGEEGAPAKPTLTEEEARAKGRALLAAARAKREAIEKAESVEREKKRISSGKAMSKTREELDALQRKRDADARKKEKADAAAAKARIRALLAADKAEREAKANPAAAAAAAAAAHAEASKATEQRAAAAAAARPAPGPAPTEGVVQLRLPGGERLTSTFGAKTPLRAVAAYVADQKPELAGTFALQPETAKAHRG
eukprot:TRINITY_DN2112_c0_g1_i3.p1 TRINITY_DN2112_c0_g1~~TRINITY_DN2112_c0_g1_i3.p1  ORF type:complete len:477 (-),score=183.69 TRINITY_DN2112_c0_g1_i3:3-1301(-)